MTRISALRALTSRKQLAELLGYQPHKLSYILYKIPADQKYSTFEIAKASGGTREISAPVPKLKELQSRLSELLQDCQTEIDLTRGSPSKFAHGFRRRHSIFSNAGVHKSRRHVFNVDIENFFGSINFGRVRGFLIKNRDFQLNAEVATVVAQIACHKNALPQGSPCSPVISNIIAHVLDIRLASLAHRNGCLYSRYADDITFSTNKKTFPPQIGFQIAKDSNLWEAGAQLEQCIVNAGFNLNNKKTRMQFRDSRQDVTGLTTNKIVNTRLEYRKNTRAMVHRLLATGSFNAEGSSLRSGEETPTIEQLQGRLSFIDQIDRYREMKNKKGSQARLRVYKDFSLYKDFYAPNKPTVICEGHTDSVYVKAAIRRYAQKYPRLALMSGGKLSEILIRFYRHTPTAARLHGLDGGSSKIKTFLLEYLNRIPTFAAPQGAHPVILLLDNDKGFAPIKALLKQKKVTVRSNERLIHVYANLYIVLTPLRNGQRQSQIEDLFSPTTLQMTLKGKTFHPSGHGFDKTKHIGKVVFAEQIVRRRQSQIGFSGFLPLLNNLDRAIVKYGEM